MITNSVFRKILMINVLFISVFCASCITQRDLEYIQDDNVNIKSFQNASEEEYHLKVNDDLFIQISSPDNTTIGMFSNTGVQQAYNLGSLQPYGASLISYTIDRDGNITLPVIGKLYVVGNTISQVSDIILESLKNILNQPVVSVKLVNRYISVLGEVRNAGHFVYAHEKITIFDAIGMAGDMTDYGNRRNVVLTRIIDQNTIRVNLDLTKSAIISSNYYYLSPGDILYIKPMRK